MDRPDRSAVCPIRPIKFPTQTPTTPHHTHQERSSIGRTANNPRATSEELPFLRTNTNPLLGKEGLNTCATTSGLFGLQDLLCGPYSNTTHSDPTSKLTTGDKHSIGTKTSTSTTGLNLTQSATLAWATRQLQLTVTNQQHRAQQGQQKKNNLQDQQENSQNNESTVAWRLCWKGNFRRPSGDNPPLPCFCRL
ncbi:hypothetical protein CHS0354_009053 [Potamilus streckersoni]|uniref:Uncharacterized protein n=1 Tax=Potamilus streckersoni TaxID=2493646 RepID=A0AAE0TI12_9BIVA|nr:hypothetical protein CHS0354_009053 [Potamilus streckersoni]